VRVDLPVCHGSRTLHRLVRPLGPFGDAIVLLENAIDGPFTWHRQLLGLHHGIAPQVVDDGSRSGDAAQALRRGISNS
jgi:hypothetical protein